jgi:hypothetical protein
VVVDIIFRDGKTNFEKATNSENAHEQFVGRA